MPHFLKQDTFAWEGWSWSQLQYSKSCQNWIPLRSSIGIVAESTKVIHIILHPLKFNSLIPDKLRYRSRTFWGQTTANVVIATRISEEMFGFDDKCPAIGKSWMFRKFLFKATFIKIIHKVFVLKGPCCGFHCDDIFGMMKNMTLDCLKVKKWPPTRVSKGHDLKYLAPWEPTFPSFLGVYTPIFWGCKTFIFHWVFRVQGQIQLKPSNFQSWARPWTSWRI